jgi:DNA-binding GntR family transcriptional regulator
MVQMMAIVEPASIDVVDYDSDEFPRPRTLASAVYARVRVEILNCDLKPGEKLLIAQLSQRFEVSAASVREALSRLVADGLIQIQDQRGFRVSPLSLTDLRDLTRTRIELECVALRLSILRGDKSWEAAVRRAWEDLLSVPHSPPNDERRLTEEWAKMHGRFHTALVAACGLEWLMRLRAILYEQSERYRRLSLAVTKRGTRDRDAEHRMIVEAALARDVDAANEHITVHFERTADNIARHYRELHLSEADAKRSKGRAR